jgi:hypothetical protein
MVPLFICTCIASLTSSGAWFDRLHGDTAKAINARLNIKPLSLFQSDVNITATLQAEYLEDIFAKIEETNTDAIVYVTVYPYGMM